MGGRSIRNIKTVLYAVCSWWNYILLMEYPENGSEFMNEEMIEKGYERVYISSGYLLTVEYYIYTYVFNR